MLQQLDDELTGKAQIPSAVAPLGMAVSDPPTQGEMQAITDKVVEMLSALVG